jgi:hypothetical protein
MNPENTSETMATPSPQRISTGRLTAELGAKLQRLATIELRLMRAEVAEGVAKEMSGVGWIAAGLGLLLAASIMLLAAAVAWMVSLGMRADMACLVAALAAVTIGAPVAVWGAITLRHAKLVPARSIKQIASLLGIGAGR